MKTLAAVSSGRLPPRLAPTRPDAASSSGPQLQRSAARPLPRPFSARAATRSRSRCHAVRPDKEHGERADRLRRQHIRPASTCCRTAAGMRPHCSSGQTAALCRGRLPVCTSWWLRWRRAAQTSTSKRRSTRCSTRSSSKSGGPCLQDPGPPTAAGNPPGQAASQPGVPPPRSSAVDAQQPQPAAPGGLLHRRHHH
jgi:hypothetical protein